jgi:hypothetical protein
MAILNSITSTVPDTHMPKSSLTIKEKNPNDKLLHQTHDLKIRKKLDQLEKTNHDRITSITTTQLHVL